jgi:hypothetical protein
MSFDSGCETAEASAAGAANLLKGDPSMAYSAFFQTLRDETKPVGTLGRGTHYSVFRAITWHDIYLNPIQEANFLDFAVIWDKDHDARVIEVAEALYRFRLLGPIRFLGERKGCLTVLLAPEAFETLDHRQIERYKERLTNQVRSTVEGFGDRWDVEVGYSTENASIIANDVLRIHTYLEFILMVWDLGIKMPSAARSAGERALQSA